MRGLLIIVLIALAIVVFLITSKGSKDEESYAERVTQAVSKKDQFYLDSKINAIKQALEAYYLDNDQYPEDLEALVPNYLAIGEYIKDPWGETFKIETDGKMTVILMSSGKDRIFGNNDDIKRRLQ